MPLDQSQRAIVRVWTSEGNKDYPGHGVGHISIETPDAYMSLWPVPFTQQQINDYRRSNTLQQKYLKYFMERKSDFHQRYEEDLAAENNMEPQVTISFYSLDVNMMENEFNKLKNSTENWRLIGSNLFVQGLEKTAETMIAHSKIIESKVGKRDVDSCASLVLKILKAGGIGQLVDTAAYSTFSSKTSSVVKPDDILDVLIPAKISEKEKHPETAGFKVNAETPLLPKKSSCVIL